MDSSGALALERQHFERLLRQEGLGVPPKGSSPEQLVDPDRLDRMPTKRARLLDARESTAARHERRLQSLRRYIRAHR
jgi:hypothetical protein